MLLVMYGSRSVPDTLFVKDFARFMMKACGNLFRKDGGEDRIFVEFKVAICLDSAPAMDAFADCADANDVLLNGVYFSEYA